MLSELPEDRQVHWRRRQARGYPRGWPTSRSPYTDHDVGPLRFFVKTLTNKVLTIHAHPTDSIEILKFKIWRLEDLLTLGDVLVVFLFPFEKTIIFFF